MDNISKLLQEAKPLYNKRKKQKITFIRFGCIIFLLFLTPMAFKIQNWQTTTDMLYSELYMDNNSLLESDTNYYIDEFDAIGII